MMVSQNSTRYPIYDYNNLIEHGEGNIIIGPVCLVALLLFTSFNMYTPPCTRNRKYVIPSLRFRCYTQK